MRALGFFAGLAVGVLLGLALEDAHHRREWQDLKRREGEVFV